MGIVNGEGAADSQVQLLGREMVLPATPSPSHPFFLSCLDLFWRDTHYNRRLVFYHSPQSGQNGCVDVRNPDLMQQLKSSLSLCLVHYYCWCGRLAEHVDPSHRLFIDCNDAGVEFVEASIDMPLSLLAQDGFQMKPFFDQLCQQPDHKGDCLFSSPLLSIQATLFSDGGVALGIAQSHVVADGQSLWHFMVSWGECSRGVPLSLLPLHDRQLLAVPHPSPEKAATWSLDLKPSDEDKVEEEELSTETDSLTIDEKGRSMEKDPSSTVKKESSNEVGDPLPTGKDIDNAIVELQSNSGSYDSSTGADSLGKDTDNAGVEPHSINGNNDSGTVSLDDGKTHPKPDSLVQWMFTLSASAMKKLKSEAGEGHSSFEVTCAHFWQRTSVARKSPIGEPTYLFVPVNCRTRKAAPLPPAYFGNVIGFGIVISTVGKVCREPLCATASRIHNKLVEVNEEWVEAFMNWLETHDNNIRSAYKSPRQLGKGMNVASSPRFPVYQVDFGWGKPLAVRTVKVTGDGELVFFGGHPGSNAGDVEICTALPSHVLEHLLADPLFVASCPSALH